MSEAEDFELDRAQPELLDGLGRTQEELRALTVRLFASQEEERRRVARELHDDINQRLAFLEIEVERLRQDLPGLEVGAVRERLEDVRDRTREVSNHVRTLSHQLHPGVLDQLGLGAALRSLVDEFEARESMFANFRQVDVPRDLTPEVAGVLYRIAQEALRNVAKHAGRTHVRVLLEGIERGVRLSIRDLGEGFDMESSAIRGLGLVSMEERARSAGGTFFVQSALGEGTTITVTIPLPGDSNG